MADPEVLKRELEYHEKLYSGFAQRHFARSAVRLLRCHMVARILHLTGVGKDSRVLSLGCGIGDTELLLAPYVAEIVGVDLSPAAIRQARADAERLEIRNVRFAEASDAEGTFDAVMAIFFLHHLADDALADLPRQVASRLAPGGTFYSLDPSRHRLSGALGRLLVPWMMRRYQSPDERELEPEATRRLFSGAGLEARAETYDFGSTPLAGLFPGWGWGYGLARELDDWLLRWEWVRQRGSNFEIVARRR
jgi:cyclopropane fatty-acyl-phospholipid synthase-like methyltransferase